ncbi:MAG: SoxR reducing system RseC family protein [Patescibacteria group bacterium]|jgi:hypothetical protein
MAKKYKSDDFSDLMAVSLIAVVSLLAYNDQKAISQTKSAVSFIFFMFMLMVLLIFALILFLNSRKSETDSKESLRLGGIQMVNLSQNQALKHDLLLYSMPIIVLFIPLAGGEKIVFNDILQVIVAFLALAYLKIIYWGKIF